MTKVLHVVEELSSVASGVTTVVRELHNQLSGANIQSKILSATSGLPKNESEYQTYFKNGLWRYTKTLAPAIEKEFESGDVIIHTHGIWMHPQYIANKLARENYRPYVVTPHAMLEPWLFKRGGLKYKIYLSLFQQQNIKNASVLHAITEAERDNLFALTAAKNIELIPNLISTAFLNNLALSAKENKEKYILYLGRLHPMKGVELLLQAFAKLRNKNIILKIAGPKDNKNDYFLMLTELAEKLDIPDRVQFLGLITGDEKYSLYRDALVFVAPSYLETIGMVNLEAGLMATPVITTFQTGIAKEWGQNGGVLINPDAEELYRALNEATSWSDHERDERGNKLKNYIFKNYSWEKNLYKWVDLYSNLIK